MARKKRKRSAPPEHPLVRLTKRHPKWVRRVAILAGLAVAAAAVWFIADPLGGTPTAIENGQEVRAGVLDREGAASRSGRPAPNFRLPDYERQAVRLDEFEGKAVFINFWASWCDVCEREMPDIVRIAEEFPDDVVVLAINRGESRGTAEGWSSSHIRDVPPNFYLLLDPREDVTREYRVDGMPQSFFVDGRGILRRELRRGLEYDEMRAALEDAFGPILPSTSTR